MDAPAFAYYDLRNVVTGVALYRTYATAHEILQANARLKECGMPSRYYPTDYQAPLLHDPC